MEKVTIFKEVVLNNTSPYLLGVGYKVFKVEKGYIEYKCPTNRILFIFNWRQDQTFYCSIRFESDMGDYPVDQIIKKLAENPPYLFGQHSEDFDLIITNWTIYLVKEFAKHDIEMITRNSAVIQELRNEERQEAQLYTQKLKTDNIQKNADKA